MRLSSSNTTATASGVRATWAANSSGKVADGIARAVSFQPCRMVWRSSGERISRLPIARSGSAITASSSRMSRPASASMLARSNRSVAYSSTPWMPAGEPSEARCSPRLTDKSNLARRGGDRLEARDQPRQLLEADRRVVLQRQHHLEQGMPRQRARRVEHLHQPLERQILVAVGRQIGRTYSRDQRAEARIAGRVGAQHQRVDEEADEIVERAVGAPRNRAADRDVAARPQPREQSRQRSLQHHEQAGAALARQRQQTAMQLRRERERQAVAAIARHRRSRPVARQLDLLRKLLERAGPERQLARYRALRIALRAQKAMLPQRVVGILHRQAPAAPARRRGSAPHSCAPSRAPAAPATSRRRRCGAAAAAAHARSRRAQTDARAAEPRWKGRSLFARRR